ncbi:MAG: archaeosine synthase subunit alpha [Candidatus Jordarchaeaceae archaeon]
MEEGKKRLFEVFKHDGPGRAGKIDLIDKKVVTPLLIHPYFPHINYDSKNIMILNVLPGSPEEPIHYNFFMANTANPLLYPTLDQNIEDQLRFHPLFLTVPCGPFVELDWKNTQSFFDNLFKNAIYFREKVAKDHLAVPLFYSKYSELCEKQIDTLSKMDFDIYVLRNLVEIIGKPRQLAEFIVKVREKIRPDSLIYAPGLINPYYYPILVYYGVDVFDTTIMIHEARRNSLLVEGGSKKIWELVELPCNCHICETYSVQEIVKMSPNDRFYKLLQHNISFASSVLKRIRLDIREGFLREKVELSSHYSPVLAASLRIMDKTYFNFLEEYTPIAKRNTVYCIGSESYHRPEIERFRKRVSERYTPISGIRTVVVLPCSAKKPYSLSQSHKKFREVISHFGKRLIQEVIISSPLGLVPRELEQVYPAAHYDVPVTGDWDKEEIDIVSVSISKYFEKLDKDTVLIAHLDGGYKEACLKASDMSGREVLFTEISGNIAGKKSLSNLKKALEEYADLSGAKEISEKVSLRKVADYQFGIGAGEKLIPDQADIKRDRIGNVRIFSDRKLIASLNQAYGLFRLTLKGAENLTNFGYWVEFDGTTISSENLFAPGVKNADPQIRPEDCVMIYNCSKELIATGISNMSGLEMSRSRKGVAVRLIEKKKMD